MPLFFPVGWRTFLWMLVTSRALACVAECDVITTIEVAQWFFQVGGVKGRQWILWPPLLLFFVGAVGVAAAPDLLGVGLY